MGLFQHKLPLPYSLVGDKVTVGEEAVHVGAGQLHNGPSFRFIRIKCSTLWWGCQGFFVGVGETKGSNNWRSIANTSG